MISRIQAQGLGPHRSLDLHLDPRKVSTITGPSEAGKTVAVLDAVTFALWGEDRTGGAFSVDLIHDDFERVDVQLTLANGTQLHRSMTRKRAIKRHRNGDYVAKETGWRNSLGPLGADPDILRAVLLPEHWQTLTGAPGNGRRLRDLLARILPDPVDLREVVRELLADQDHDLRPGDTVDEPTAVERRAQVNKARDRNAGQIDALRDLVDAATTDPVQIPDAGDALDLVEADRLWKAHRDALDRRAERIERNAKDAERLRFWERARAELGQEPAGDDTPIRLAREALAEADAEAHQARQQLLERSRLLSAAAEAVEVAREAPDPRRAELHEALIKASAALADLQAPHCPTCGQIRPATAAEQRRAEAQHGKALAAYNAEREPAEARRAEVIDGREAPVEECRARLEKARNRVAEAEDAHTRAQADLEAAIAEGGKAASWQASLRRLGPRPVVPEDPPEPPAPSMPEPEPEKVEAAAALLRRQAEAEARAEQRDADTKKAAQALAAAEAAQPELEAEAARLDDLVDAVRRAPSIVAERNLGALGELGPVSLVLKGAGVEVLFDGRPWWTASRGRRLVCDLYLRMALRRGAGVRWLPLVVDDAQSWSGEWPEVAAPAVFLWTAGEALAVAA
jgi:hypothetical protein